MERDTEALDHTERQSEMPTEAQSSTDLAALFSVKKKTTKKIKISLEGRDEPEAVEIVQKTEKSFIDTSKSLSTDTTNSITVSKLDYATVNATKESPNFATATGEYDTEFDRDHLARRKEALERSRDLAAKGELDTKYRGLKGYQQFLMQGDTAKANAASDKNRVAGPVRATANLRVTCRFDYKPDLCKDYNETGFCGFGDSCIFLHDRTEHKSSYQLEQEWEADQKRKQLEKDNAESLVTAKTTAKSKPTDCSVCRGAFVNPVKTKCDHYFCEKCVKCRFQLISVNRFRCFNGCAKIWNILSCLKLQRIVKMILQKDYFTLQHLLLPVIPGLIKEYRSHSIRF